MNIIYFTTALKDIDFKGFSQSWKTPLNPSNQNFHNKLIRSLAINNKVNVISLRPYSKKYCRIPKLVSESSTEGNISWHYLAIPRNKLFILNSCAKQSKEILKSLITKDTVFLFDTMNQKAIYVANKMKAKYKKPAIGICTDDPRNISGVKPSFIKNILKNTNNLDGYVCLTEGLNELFNVNTMPNYILEGIVEDEQPRKVENVYGDYIFFGGSLMMKYGIKDLIKAFESLNKSNLRLVICGHHEEPWLKDKINRLPNSVYLGILPVKQVLQLEKNALVNINPRPYSEKFDKYSIPSKTIEYLSSGTLTISCKNTILEKEFKDDIVWCESTQEGIKEAIEKVIKMSAKKREEMGTRAKEKVMELYSLTSVNEKINNFLIQFIK